MRHSVLFVACLAAFLTGCFSDRRSITVDGRTRAYILTVPETLPADQPVPLLLALHQFSDSAEGMRSLSGFDDIAAREQFIVAYPQGRFRIWNSRGDGDVNDVAFLAALVEQVAAAHNIDRNRIYATGISAGGMMAQFLACQTDLLAAIAPVAGSQPRNVLAACARDTPVPVLTIHGEEDNIVPFGGGDVSTGGGDFSFASAAETAALWAEKNGCADTPTEDVLPPLDPADANRVTRFTYDCPPGGPVVFYSIAGGGHTWPGRDNWYPAFIVGPTSRQLDASETIWAFLKAQRKP